MPRPVWLPSGPPHTQISKAVWAYLLPAQRPKLYARTPEHGQVFYWWTGCKTELSALLRYF